MSIKGFRWLTAISGACVGLFLYLTIVARNGERSGWLQVAIAFAALPVLVSELQQIRKEITRKPKLEIALASVHNLPLSKIREAQNLSHKINIEVGYPHFYLVIRNTGIAAAEFVKIHLDYTSFDDRNSIYFPLLKTSEFSSQKSDYFYRENNADFLFKGGSDWVIHPDDVEIFGFYFQTTVEKSKEPPQAWEGLKLGVYGLKCRLWAQGLEAPVTADLKVEIVDRITFQIV